MGAVDMIHPDLASSGGLIETKKIGDYAMEHGVAMAMHFAGTPISFMANVHMRRRHRELRGPRAPLARRAVVGRAWSRDVDGKAARRQGLRACLRTRQGLASSRTKTPSASTCGRAAATSSPRRSGTRNDRGTGRGAEDGQPLALTLRELARGAPQEDVLAPKPRSVSPGAQLHRRRIAALGAQRFSSETRLIEGV